MLKPNLLTKFLVIFAISFISMILITNVEAVSKTHCKVYTTLATPLFNVLNPHVFAEFHQGAVESQNDWDISFFIWDKRQYGRELFLPVFRSKNPPKGKLYQNHKEIILLPFIFILALMFASPIKLRPKLIKTVSAIFVFYIFMTLYLSYRFEFTLNRQELPLDSLWHIIISFFGMGGNTDPIYIFVFLLWAVLVIPHIIRKGEIFTNQSKS